LFLSFIYNSYIYVHTAISPIEIGSKYKGNITGSEGHSGTANWLFFESHISTNGSYALLVTLEYDTANCSMDSGLVVALNGTLPTRYGTYNTPSHTQVGATQTLNYLLVPRSDVAVGVWAIGVFSITSTLCSFDFFARYQ